MARRTANISKEVIQSYLVTSARYDFSVYEKRILYRIVEIMQAELSGQPIGKGIRIQPTLFADKIITMPISAFFLREEDKNYDRIRKAFKSLSGRVIEKATEKSHIGYPVIQYYEVPRRSGEVRFQIGKLLYADLMDFAKGYSQYELQTAFSFRSQYTMRLYELTCKQQREITYSIERLRQMFGLEDRYKETKDFIKKVIVPAQKELEESQSASYFTYQRIKTGRSFTHVRFTTHYRNLDKAPPLLPLADTSGDGPLRELMDFLNKELGTSDRNWKPHVELLIANLNIPKEGRKPNELIQILQGAQYAENAVGYVVNALKKRITE